MLLLAVLSGCTPDLEGGWVFQIQKPGAIADERVISLVDITPSDQSPLADAEEWHIRLGPGLDGSVTGGQLTATGDDVTLRADVHGEILEGSIDIAGSSTTTLDFRADRIQLDRYPP
jgi:hypothetical protein